MKASIITIGDELLIGQTVDTNSAWMGSELSQAGFDVQRSISIHDRREDILAELGAAARINDVVLITGGLGPTSDDITKQTLCEFFGTRLVMNSKVLEMITTMMSRRNFPLNDNNRRQAEVPESCRVLENATGTAPGMWFEKDNTIFVSMPGVPFEMKHIMSVHVLPELKRRFTTQVILHRNIMTFGTYEAKLSEILTDFEKELPGEVKLAYLPSWGVIKLRLTCTGNDIGEVEEIISSQVEKLYSIIPEYIYAENEETLEATVGKLLKMNHKTLSTAESCTGGEIASMITGVSGSSAWYKGSVVAYSNEIKTKFLGVPQEDIESYGAVSENVVRAMAEGALSRFGSDYAIATSGIAGPDGGSELKPVGTVWIAVASMHGTVTDHKVLGTERISNIRRFSLNALNLMRRELLAHEKKS
ncbi:MAG TPA: competence/damage-inducible protein A [Bacteroidales bacterium]|nr:competence/damage-inducible protein A [Bacteroidales bacterium]